MRRFQMGGGGGGGGGRGGGGGGGGGVGSLTSSEQFAQDPTGQFRGFSPPSPGMTAISMFLLRSSASGV